MSFLTEFHALRNSVILTSMELDGSVPSMRHFQMDLLANSSMVGSIYISVFFRLIIRTSPIPDSKNLTHSITIVPPE
jgi:hypothetical protein